MGEGSGPSPGVASLPTRLDGVLELVGSSCSLGGSARRSVGVCLRNVVIEQLSGPGGWAVSPAHSMDKGYKAGHSVGLHSYHDVE